MSLERITLTGYSTALFSTWYFVDEMKLLFDCGDGVSAGMLQKSRKATDVFISHSDRDHVDGLLQFNQLNSRPGLSIYYPKDSGSFPALRNFGIKFDPYVEETKWIGLERDAVVNLRKDFRVRVVENRHVPNPDGMVKSLSFIVERLIRKLKPELTGLSGPELGAIRKEHGEAAITNVEYRSVLAYSGDMPIETDGRFDEVETLIHEATFLTEAEIVSDNPRRNKHSSLDQVIRMVAESNIQRLVLGHFSSRYDRDEILKAVDKNCREFGVKIPVYSILPGQIVRDVFVVNSD